MSSLPAESSKTTSKPLLVTAAVSALLAFVAAGAIGSGPPLLGFVGRVHPLVVHMPIGVLILVVTLELAAMRSEAFREKLRTVMPAVLTFLVVSSLAAFAIGLLLGRSGDYPQKLLTKHRLLTFVSVLGAAATLAAFALQNGAHEAAKRGLYRALLGLTLGAMSLGGHVGGSLSRGEGYLFQLAPGFVQKLAGYTPKPPATAEPAAVPGTEPKVFADVLLPALQKKCGECHAGEKSKGGLKVDSRAAMLKGGLSGTSLVPSASGKSLLVERMKLPKDSDDHMPPDDKPGFSAEELALLEYWIDRGASEELTVKDALSPAASRGLLEAAAKR